MLQGVNLANLNSEVTSLSVNIILIHLIFPSEYLNMVHQLVKVDVILSKKN